MSNISTEQMLYTDADLEAAMDKIETINFHEEKEVRLTHHVGVIFGVIVISVIVFSVIVIGVGVFGVTLVQFFFY